MAGLTLTLNTAKDTLLNTQAQIQTATNNISNAQNKNYARQTASVTFNRAVGYYPNWIGTGADVTSISQVRDQFLEQRLRDAVSDENQYSTLYSELQTVQSVFSDSGDTGISQSLASFFSAWDTLSQNPTGVAQQTGVYSAAQNLAQTIRDAYNNLNESATQLTTKVSDTVDEANSLISQIADLNKAISINETSTHPANDLRDQRYQALKDLAALIPVNATEDSSGVMTVTTTTSSGSLTLVTGATVNNTLTTSTAVTGGELGGLKNAQDDLNTATTGYIARLNDFAAQLITNVNSIHQANSGTPVFTGSDATDIAASTTFLSGQSATDEASRAVAMGELQATTITTWADGKSATLNQYLGDLQKTIGTDAQNAKTGLNFNESLSNELESQQQSISGVSIDEELVNIIQYQHVYEAAAKVVQKTSDMLATIMNMIR